MESRTRPPKTLRPGARLLRPQRGPATTDSGARRRPAIAGVHTTTPRPVQRAGCPAATTGRARSGIRPAAQRWPAPVLRCTGGFVPRHCRSARCSRRCRAPGAGCRIVRAQPSRPTRHPATPPRAPARMCHPRPQGAHWQCPSSRPLMLLTHRTADDCRAGYPASSPGRTRS